MNTLGWFKARKNLQNLQTVKTPHRVILTSSNHKPCKVRCPLIFLDDSFLYLIVTKCKYQFFQTLSYLVMNKEKKKEIGRQKNNPNIQNLPNEHSICL